MLFRRQRETMALRPSKADAFSRKQFIGDQFELVGSDSGHFSFRAFTL